MAEHEESVAESLLEKITEKFHGGDSSSSDSDGEKSSVVDSSAPSAAEVVKAKIYRLFGREKPVHKVLGGGKRTDRPSLMPFPLKDFACIFNIIKPFSIFFLHRFDLDRIRRLA